MCLITVIIPAYNQAQYLADAVGSVLAQSYEQFEVLIIDDGSTDNTRQVAQSFDDPRVHYRYQANRGLSGARNSGIRCARGAYLTYLDSDDLFLPCKLELLLAFMEENPKVGLVAGQAVPIDEVGRHIGKLFDAELPQDGARLLLSNPLHVGSVLLRREWQEKVGFFDETLRSYEDWDMWLRLALAGCQMAWLPQPVSQYRFHRAQMTRDGRQMTTASFAVLDKLFANHDLPTDWLALRDKAYSQAHLRAAAQAYLGRNFTAGGEHLTTAATLSPELLAEGGRSLAAHFAAWTELPKNDAPLLFLQDIYDNLPQALAALRPRRRSELGRMAMERAFKRYEQGDMPEARRAVRRAIQCQPGWLLNRGALSIFIRSHLRS